MNIALLAALLALGNDPTSPAFIVPLAAEGMALEGNGMLSVIVDESDQRADLNGDGDLDDSVAHLITPGTWEVMNLGVAVDPVAPLVEVDETRAVVAVSEAQMGADANGDGDLSDFVYHTVDLSTGETTSLGLSALAFFGKAELAHDRVLVRAQEPGQGATDLNGDGDAEDIVLSTLDYAGNLVSPSLATSFLSAPEAIGPGYTLALALEFSQGAADLNGDGDLSDEVLQLLAVGGPWLNTGVACDWVLQGSDLDPLLEPFAFVGVSEDGQGVDLNLDGDTFDTIPFGFSFLTGTFFVSPLGFEGGLVDLPWAVSERTESSVPADLNGDGDLNDTVLRAIDASTGAVTIVPYALGQTAGNDYLLHGSSLVLLVAGDQLGMPAPGTNAWVSIYDLETGELNVLDNGGSAFGDLATFRRSEGGDFGDLLGDGDEDDQVPYVVSVELGTGIQLPLAVQDGTSAVYDSIHSTGGLVFVAAAEAATGQTDLNGDGDVDDRVLHVYAPESSTLYNLGIAQATAKNVVADGTWTYVLVEELQLGTDANGDGDRFDTVVVAYAPFE